MEYTLRDYQIEAVDAALRFFSSKPKYHALEVLPTGSGKSLIIANIAKELNEPILIFQPRKEILEQNLSKLLSYGHYATAYSASVGQKRLSPITFATIGSVIKKTDILKDFKHIIVDECHFVNAKGGMYRDLFQKLGKVKILGLTATPYRLVTDGYGGSILKFLTRTRPRVFKDLIYYVQNEELFTQGYLAKLKYQSTNGFDRSQLRLNTTGADYTDRSVMGYFDQVNFKDRIANVVNDLKRARRGILVFTRFVKEAQYLTDNIPGAAIITAKTHKRIREQTLNSFKSGRIPVVCNVGVLSVGFDYPELDTIIMARPTLSLALFYQMIGRAIRPHPLKDHALVVDMCDNLRMFGSIEKLRINDGGNGKWFISNNGKQLTNIYYGERSGHNGRKVWKARGKNQINRENAGDRPEGQGDLQDLYRGKEE